MNGFKLLAVFLIVLAALWGCASTQDDGANDLRIQYLNEGNPRYDKISRGLVEIGMTKNEVRAALANVPEYRRNFEGDRWSYVEFVISGENGAQETGKVLYFTDGKVSNIRGFLRGEDNSFYSEWD